MRHPLSTYTDGSFLPLDTALSTLVHRQDANTSTTYVRIMGYNRGKRVRNVSFIFNDEEAIYASVQATGNAQILVPDIPLYNNTSIDVYCSLKQSVSAWNIPDNINDIILLENGQVVGIVVANISANTDAQPLLIHVQDSRRSTTDIDPDKGSEAIIEIYQTNGSVAVEILKSGFNLLSDNIQTDLRSGIYFYGDIFVE